MGSRSKCKKLVTDRNGKFKDFRHGGAFGGKSRYLAPNVPMKPKKKA